MFPRLGICNLKVLFPSEIKDECLPLTREPAQASSAKPVTEFGIQLSQLVVDWNITLVFFWTLQSTIEYIARTFPRRRHHTVFVPSELGTPEGNRFAHQFTVLGWMKQFIAMANRYLQHHISPPRLSLPNTSGQT